MVKTDFYFAGELYQSVELAGERSRVAVAVAGRVGPLQIRFSLPILDMQMYWTPECRVPVCKLLWQIEIQAAAQRHFPYLAFGTAAGANRASVAVSNFIDDCRISARMNQATCQYDITITIVLQKETEDFHFCLDRRGTLGWLDILREFVQQQCGPAVPYPAAAWSPVYCTWYAVHAAVTQEWAEKTAAAAARLGFGTFIVDDGWCFDVMKRVSPETITTWYENIGDWEVSTQKFPDMAGHVLRVQGMGLKYLLWVAPHLVGDRSRLYQEIRSELGRDYLEGYYLLDVTRPGPCRILQEKIVALLERYGLDGLKIDFLDQYWPTVEQPRGRRTLGFIRDLSEAIRSRRPEALIEFRQGYATPAMLPYGTQFRAGDVPFDYLDNFMRLAQIRVGLPESGVPVHADPAYWHPQESRENIARHLMAALAGVPMLSMDLLSLQPHEEAIIRHWLGFYREHLGTFQSGVWRVGYHQSTLCHMRVQSAAECIVLLNDAARLDVALAGAAGCLHVLNLSPETVDWGRGEVFGPAGERLPGDRLPPGARGVAAG